MTSKSTIVVRYAETDKMGITHHAVYPIWYEQARSDFIKILGVTYSQMEQDGIQLPLVELRCRYARPCTYEDVLEVQTSIRLLTPAKIEFEYRVFKGAQEAPINVGSTLHAWVNADMRPFNLKKKHPALYRLLEQAAQADEA